MSDVQMFIVSWRNATLEHRHWGLDDYVMALNTAVDAARAITGSPDAISSPVTIPFRMVRAFAARIVAGELNRPSVESSSAPLVSSTHTAQVVLATLLSFPAASHPR